MSDKLFADLSPGDPPEAAPAEPRYETANRAQVELYPCDLEALLPPDHAARLVWRFVEGLQLEAFYAAIAAREGHPGRPAIDPKILLALWLYATIDGVGSAREVDRLCQHHDAYRWIRGGVPVNYHTLSDFRVAHQAALDDLLTQSIAALVHRGVVTLARVAHDGTRVRASAGVKSFRRRPRLAECLRVARHQVERTARQPEGGATSRQAAAQARAARDRLARVEAALEELPAVEAAKARKKSKVAPRVSTTDPDARVMKMTDGGFRPAYNVQLATDVDGRAIVGVGVSQVGSDQGELVPMLDQIAERAGRVPAAEVVDGGFATRAAITTAAARGVTIYAPVAKPKGDRAPGVPCKGDSAAVAAWRARMATEEGRRIYKARAATAEWINADTRTHRTLGHVLLRGVGKVHCWVLWVALAQNMMRTMDIIPHLMT
ncbi:MAG: IS1182 family transposase [Alphaproteobacteria bacterium]